MAHELDFSKGFAAVVTVGESAWHREGTTVPRGHPAERKVGLTLELAGLDFEVAKVEHYIKVPREPAGSPWADAPWAPPPEYRASEDAWSVVRTDTHGVLGTVGSVWNPLQNDRAFAPIQPALDLGIATIETAGALRGGRHVWMLVRFDTDAITELVWANESTRRAVREMEDLFEEILPYGLFFNAHDRSSMAKVRKTAIRVVCANTLDWSLSKDEGYEIAVTHSTHVEEAYAAATDDLFKSVAVEMVKLATYRDLFRATKLAQADFRRIVLDTAVPVRHLEARIARREAKPQTYAALDRAHVRRDRISQLWTNGAGNVGDESVWEAWNGLIEWLDHDEQTQPKGTTTRLDSLAGGTLGSIKRKTFRRLLTYCEPEDGTMTALVPSTN